MRWIGWLLLALVCLLPLGPAAAQSQHDDLTLESGETIFVDCDGTLSGVPTADGLQIQCAPLAAVALEPRPVGVHGHDQLGLCRESMNAWHPAVVGSCATGHEHGDAPPDWVVIKSVREALNVFDFQAAARVKIPVQHYVFVNEGVFNQETDIANRVALGRYQVRPRRMSNFGSIDQSVDVYGVKWDSPIFLYIGAVDGDPITPTLDWRGAVGLGAAFGVGLAVAGALLGRLTRGR